jgi:zinc D-Ala-D-Ala carboxypeptidase
MKLLIKRFFGAMVCLCLFSPAAYSQNTTVTKAFLTGRINYTRDTSFTKVDRKYSDNNVYLKKETYSAYQKMYAAALKDGIRLNIISGTRSC